MQMTGPQGHGLGRSGDREISKRPIFTLLSRVFQGVIRLLAQIGGRTQDAQVHSGSNLARRYTVSKSNAVKSFTSRTLMRALALVAVSACTEVPSAPNAILLTPSLAKANAWGPYAAMFADGADDKLQSDGRGIYFEDVDCVGSNTYAGGLYQLRTIKNTGVCKAQTRGTWRFFTIDFGTPVLDLDQDGIAEAIEFAPARLGADNAFAQGATSTSVNIFILEVVAGDSTTQNFKYTLIYQNKVPVSGSSVRVVQAMPGSAAVRIYAGAVDLRRPDPGLLVGTRDLPFKLTLTPQ
jgi:hypothetical protein